VNIRHNQVVQALARLGREAGMVVVVEPNYHDHHARPDASFSGLDALTLVDVSVAHPAAPSALPAAAQRPRAAAQAREQAKDRKYAAMAQAEGAAFTPFVLETHGAMGKRAGLFLDQLAAHWSASGGGDPRPFRERAARVLSLALQCGNARVAVGGTVLVRQGRAARGLPPPPAY
jgi:hypothetical protein